MEKGRLVGTFIIVAILPRLVAMWRLGGGGAQLPGASAGAVRTDPILQFTFWTLMMCFIPNTFVTLLFSICRHFTSLRENRWQRDSIRTSLPFSVCRLRQLLLMIYVGFFSTVFHFCLFVFPFEKSTIVRKCF